MPKALDLTGVRFGKLTALKYVGVRNKVISVWLCKCDCGREKEVRLCHLRSGMTVSCGCKVTTHGMKYHPIYAVWTSMRQRCENSRHKFFHRYGGRGISVCHRWAKFENFRDDMFPTYKKGLTLDRTNNDGNYEPSNCKWVTPKEQCNNRDNSRMYLNFTKNTP